MVANTIQFAVVREDPNVEIEIFRELKGAKNVCLIGSGGCTAFAMQCEFPDINISLLEPNPSQVNLIQKKAKILREKNRLEIYEAFGVDNDSSNTLTNCGNFESLFRSFRNFIFEFVCDRTKWERFFKSVGEESIDRGVFNSKYWPVAFELFFSDSLLNAMFGPEATQHAEPGSYPKYFRKVIERGLLTSGAKQNYFLHHIFLGNYLSQPECLPSYLINFPQKSKELMFIETFAQEAPNYGGFDLISLSNIFDWMGEQEITKVIERLSVEMKAGGVLVYRQLNNTKDLEQFFGSRFKFQKQLARDLHGQDRSLFYSSIHIGQRI